jgi:hypothetical protein
MINYLTRVEVLNADAFEIPGVPGDDGQATCQRGARDEPIVLGRFVWYVQRRDAAGGREIEWQDAVGEAGEDIVFEPSGQDASLAGVGSLFPQDPGLDLDDGHDTDGKIRRALPGHPLLDPGVTAPPSEFANDIGVEQVHHTSVARMSKPTGSISNSTSSSISSQSARSAGVRRSR